MDLRSRYTPSMCTVAVLRSPGQLIIAANRDEAPSRPALPPRLWPAPAPGTLSAVAGVDVRSGGTWLGVNAAGLCIAVTNLWWGDFRRPRPRSRGQVVADLLAHARSPDEAQDLLAQQPRDQLGPFNLIACSLHGGGFVAAVAADLFRSYPLAGAVQVIGNLLPDAHGDKICRIQAELEQRACQDLGDVRQEAVLALVLSRHTARGDPRESACVHTDRDYGTVSSSLISLSHAAPWRWRYAEGSPCRTPFRDYSSPLERLSSPPRPPQPRPQPQGPQR